MSCFAHCSPCRRTCRMHARSYSSMRTEPLLRYPVSSIRTRVSWMRHSQRSLSSSYLNCYALHLSDLFSSLAFVSGGFNPTVSSELSLDMAVDGALNTWSLKIINKHSSLRQLLTPLKFHEAECVWSRSAGTIHGS